MSSKLNIKEAIKLALNERKGKTSRNRKKKKIDFDLIEPKIRKTVKKSYADNFLR